MVFDDLESIPVLLQQFQHAPVKVLQSFFLLLVDLVHLHLGLNVLFLVDLIVVLESRLQVIIVWHLLDLILNQLNILVYILYKVLIFIDFLFEILDFFLDGVLDS